ncbi:co-chaperone DjlA [Methylomonas methanica]|uniref:Co-chaperone protein DjlA n=1 Tax=Methylomonas methanica TaxID=421 RepID=A0A177M7G7_METMH|nr:co-chaperone DjlA [Methylomonas methanica]OAI01666.1 molecular chaperone DjlA [Methylomonas methanica]
MSWLGKLVGGAFGFMLGGPLGAIFGASIGHQFDAGMDGMAGESFNPGDQQRVQMAFFTATFAVMGHVAKADGRVSNEEIGLAKRVMDNMELNPELREVAVQLFQQGKQVDFPLADVLRQFRVECHRRTHLVRMFVEIQIQAAFADGIYDAKEEKLLLDICAQLGVSRFEYQIIKGQVQAQHRFQQSGEQFQTAKAGLSKLEDAYAVLGIAATADDADVKKAYRRLMSQHHPDKLVAKGLPEEMMQMAKQKTQQIRKAYETIREARGF